MSEKKLSELDEGLASAIKMQRSREAQPDRGFSSRPVPQDCAGMLFYLAGCLSADKEASVLLQEMGGMVRDELAAAKAVAA